MTDAGALHIRQAVRDMSEEESEAAKSINSFRPDRVADGFSKCDSNSMGGENLLLPSAKDHACKHNRSVAGA
jgi:hypothetical protein